MNQEEIIEKSEAFVKQSFESAEGGHDWWHTWRVWRLSIRIALKENADIFVTSLGALFHDIADPKFHNGDEDKGVKISRDFLSSLGVDDSILTRVEDIIRRISFKGGIPDPLPKSAELKCVQDADRLDAMGAVGIARAFSYGGYKGRKIHDPEQDAQKYNSADEYRKSKSPTINHFYEKLLLIKDLMNTKTGRKLAKKRHKFMEAFLNEFFDEIK
jgi:uncharacterized protein